jgi:hypothetical protein
MKKRRRSLWLALGLGGLCAIMLCASLGVLAAVFAVNDRGSSELAAKWKAELTEYSSPDVAQARNPDVIVIRFGNGEWVFGLCRNSHGAWTRGGGTVVVKDSKGQIRAFFGHVCGDCLGAFWETTSLDLYYQKTLNCEFGFVEHPLP